MASTLSTWKGRHAAEHVLWYSAIGSRRLHLLDDLGSAVLVATNNGPGSAGLRESYRDPHPNPRRPTYHHSFFANQADRLVLEAQLGKCWHRGGKAVDGESRGDSDKSNS